MTNEQAQFVLAITFDDRDKTQEQREALRVLREQFVCACGESLGFRDGLFHCSNCKKTAASAIYLRRGLV